MDAPPRHRQQTTGFIDYQEVLIAINDIQTSIWRWYVVRIEIVHNTEQKNRDTMRVP